MLNDLDGLDDLYESLRLGLEIGAGPETAFAYANLGDWSWPIEGADVCLEKNAEGIEFSERRGFEHNAYWLRMANLPLLFDLARWDELLALADEVVAFEQTRGESQMTTVALLERSRVLVHRGFAVEAKELSDAALEPARGVGDPQVVTRALVCAALAEHAVGDDGAAVRFAEEFEKATRGRAAMHRAWWIPDVARLCAATRTFALAEGLLQDIDVLARGHVCAVQTARAVLDEARGDVDAGLGGYTEVAEQWHEFGNVVEEAHALLGQARCLVALDRHDEAKEPIGAARAIFDQLGALPLVDEAERVREQLLSRASGS